LQNQRRQQQRGELRVDADEDNDDDDDEGEIAAAFGSALHKVEQEREVAFQVEEVREIQKPPAYKPHKFPGLHEQIAKFARGEILGGGDGVGDGVVYFEMFDAIGQTKMGLQFGVNRGSSPVFVSAESLRTVKTTSGRNEGMMVSWSWICRVGLYCYIYIY